MALLLTLQEVYKEFSGEKLFQPLSFNLHTHDRVAILGPNGTGKSTLIKMILGQEEISGGNIIIPKSTKIGYLSQDVIEDYNHTLYEEVLSVFKKIIDDEKRLDEIVKRLENNPLDEELLNEYYSLQTEFENENGYDYKYKIHTILNMFSFSQEDYNRPISSFSGGEKTRVAFAKLLLIEPDLLVLDEPTNHLDIISIEWLEDYLSTYTGSILFVSHDITFVRKLANRVLDIDNKVFTMYNCTYDNFAKEKKDKYQNLLQQYRAQEEEKEKLKKFITFYMPKPRFASRAHDREKKLARLEANSISDPSKVKTRKLNIELSGQVRAGKKLFDFDNVSIGYDSKLVDNISFTLFGQNHLALMGANGSGKSTFAKVVLNQLKPLTGEIRRYFHLSMGILKQDIVSYQSEDTLFKHFRNLYPKMTNEEIYSGLGRYAFSYADANEKRLCDLSGGELMRIEILQLSLEDYDLLILDEPTNHLDMLSISELIDALNEYDGTLIIISHNRDFIDKTCDKLLYFYNKHAYYYEGNYESFRDEKLKNIIAVEKEKIDKENREKREEKLIVKREKNSLYNEKKNKTRLTRKSPEKILEKIDRLEKQKSELEGLCSLSEYYNFPEKLKEISTKTEELNKEIESLYKELEMAM